jgi:hypothetical protein
VAKTTGQNWWGKGAGCDFVSRPCISGGKANFPKYFCDDPQRVQCACASRIATA